MMAKYGNSDEDYIIHCDNATTSNTASNVKIFTVIETLKSQFVCANLGKMVPPSVSFTTNDQDLSTLTSTWNNGKLS